MPVTMTQLLVGAAVLLALEGLLYAVAPGVMRCAVTIPATLPERWLRLGGLAAAAVGTAAAWFLAGG